MASKDFSLAVLNFYVSVRATWWAAACLSGNEEWNMDINSVTVHAAAGAAAGEAAWYAYAAAGPAEEFAARDAAEFVARDVGSTVAGEAAGNAKKTGGTPQQIRHAAFQLVIIDRKKNEETLRNRAYRKIPGTVLTTEEKMKIISRLMTYDEEKFDRLKLTIPFQLNYILFRIEYLVKVEAKLDVAQENQLMKEHGDLAKNLELQGLYLSLFDGINEKTLVLHWPSTCHFPKELLSIIASYTQLSCHNSDDVEEIISRIVTK